jgi:hypothetical protein
MRRDRGLMRYTNVIIATLVGLLGFAEAGVAQEARLAPGARIRFRIGTSDTLHVAELSRGSADSLILQSCQTCSRLSYVRTEVNQLAVFRPLNRGDRIIVGLGIGAAIGAGIGYLSSRNCRTYERCDLAFLAVPVDAILGGIFGGMAGFISAYRWDPITPGS